MDTLHDVSLEERNRNMHFRHRGPSIQLVRTKYDPETKRAMQEVVGRVPRASFRLPDDVAAKLSAEETAEVNAYIERAKTLDLLRQKLAAHSLPQVIDEAIEYARNVEDEAERDLLRAQFAQAIVALRRATAAPVRAAGA
jgi:hypothetical protein